MADSKKELPVDEIRKKLKLSEEELFKALGAENPEAFYAAPPSDEQLKRDGRGLFNKLYERAKKVICNETFRASLKLEEDEEKLTVAVYEILSTVLTGFPLVTISVLIVKMGLDGFCGNEAVPLQPSPA